MTIRKLPRVQAFERPKGIEWDPPSDALVRWADMPRAAESDDPATISILDVIGEDFWTGGGVTAKTVSRQLKAIGSQDVRVEINSPGGDLFDGLAIYNLLVDHPARVEVKVLGMAASAASVIAMAGDQVTMGRGTFLMIHNTWVLALGNRHDMRKVADTLEPFDSAMADIYSARSGLEADAVGEMMDAETWINGSDAVKQGFADDVSDAEPVSGDAEARSGLTAKRKIDAILAGQGMPRSERRRLFRQISGGMHDAAPEATLRAGDIAAVGSLIKTLQT